MMWLMKRAVGPLLVVTAATILSAAGLALASLRTDESQAARAQSGLRGTVYIGPITPVCTLYEPCEAPAPGVTLTFTRGVLVIRRTTTAKDGSYRVLLPAAIYTVSSDVRGIERNNAPFPRRIKVRAGHIDKLDFRIDTGIR
jgi:hypothetical protein